MHITPPDGKHLSTIRHVVVPLVAGALAYLLARLAVDGHEWAIVTALIIGGVTLIAGLLLDVKAHVASLERAPRQASDEHTALPGAVASPVYDELSDLAYKAGRIDNNTPPLLIALSRGELRTASRRLDEFGRREEVTYGGEDREWLLRLTRETRRSIRATSMNTVDAGGRDFADGGLWRSPLGQSYLEEQRLAVLRGVSIQRVFIMDRPELLDDANFKEVWNQQLDCGIQVRVIDPSVLPGGPDSATDFILFDKEISYETTTDAPLPSGHPVIGKTSLISDSDRVLERAHYFEKLWAAATV